jgi:hypothetical protein
MIGAGHVAHIGERRGAYRALVLREKTTWKTEV